MRKLITHLGFALAACLSLFSVSALAEPAVAAYRTAFVIGEPHGVALKRLELTLAMWRTGSQAGDEAPAANMRSSSNHFVMVSAKPDPDGIGVGAGLSRC